MFVTYCYDFFLLMKYTREWRNTNLVLAFLPKFKQLNLKQSITPYTNIEEERKKETKNEREKMRVKNISLGA